MTTPSANPDQLTLTMLQELATVRGQLTSILTMLQQQSDATNRRIDDLNESIGTRFDGLEGRMATLEANERSTALKVTAAGAVSGAVVSGAMHLIKNLLQN